MLPAPPAIRLLTLSLLLVATAMLSAQPTIGPNPVNVGLDVTRSAVQTLPIEVSPLGDLLITSLVTPDDETLTLVLEKHSIRADGFQLLIDNGSGALIPVTAPDVTTYRGTVSEDPSFRVRASYFDGELRALLCSPTRTLAVQPFADAVPGSTTGQHVVHDATDGTPPPGECGVNGGSFAGGSGGGGSVAGGSGSGELEVCEIGLDADFLYYQGLNSSIAATVSDMETVMNAVGNLYEVPTIQIRYEITTIIVRTSPGTYTSTTAGGRLSQFRSNWQNSPESGIERDVAHLFTGQDLAGSTIGVAYPGTICGSSGYALSQSRYVTNLIFRTSLTAHELGHNWSAGHCNSSNPCRVMCSANGACNGLTPLEFGPSAITQILNEKASVFCLEPQPPTLLPPFEESWDSSSISDNVWSYYDGASITSSISGEPSAPFALRLNASGSGPFQDDDIRSTFIDTTSLDNPTLQFSVQREGVPSGGTLLVQYWGLTQRWVTIDTLVSDGIDPGAFETRVYGLSWSARHTEFRIRFTVDVNGTSERWHIDDISLVDGAPNPNDPPSVLSVLPATGPLTGGTDITITGENFANNAAILLGTRPLENFVYVSSTEIQGTTPSALIPGAVDLTVGQASGSILVPDAFTYSSNTLALESGEGTPGGSFSLDALSTNDLPLGGYSFAGTFDGSQLQLDGLDVTGTDAEGADFVAPSVSNTPGDEWFTIGVVLDLVPPIETVLPVGTSNRIARFDWTVKPDATLETITEVTFEGGLGNPPVDIVFSLEGGITTVPSLFAGQIFIVDTAFVRGDGNGDGVVNIADPVANLDYQFSLGPALCLDAYDVNDDGTVDISDPIYNLTFLFSFGAPPFPPHPDAGIDPTPDALDCENPLP